MKLFSKFYFLTLIILMDSSLTVFVNSVRLTRFIRNGRFAFGNTNRNINRNERAQFGRNYQRGSRGLIDRDDGYLQTPDLIRKYGYRAESHEVTTEDGYKLVLHRIPNPGRPVVAFFHGILCSSKEWFMPVTGSVNDSIGFMTAAAGYDVWFHNARGNHYSKDHVNMSTNSQAYWDFGDDEQAYFDVPAIIDYILKETSQEKINYIGFSMGTIIFFKALARRTEYNDKINLFIGYAPGGGSFGNCSSPIGKFLARLAKPEEPLKGLATIVANGEIVPSYLQSVLAPIWFFLCGTVRFVCDQMIWAMTGFSPGKVNDDVWDVFYGEFPSSTSVRTTVQVLQETNVKTSGAPFYDFGSNQNLKIYGSSAPPLYDLTQVTAKCVLFSGLTDAIISYKDTDWLASQLPNVVASVRVNHPNSWAHHDYYLSRTAPEIVYKPTLEYLASFNEINWLT